MNPETRPKKTPFETLPLKAQAALAVSIQRKIESDTCAFSGFTHDFGQEVHLLYGADGEISGYITMVIFLEAYEIDGEIFECEATPPVEYQVSLE
jgi:hypothetical protein